MSTTPQDTCASVARLADVLTRLGDALARPDLDSLVAHEALLAELTTTLGDATASPGDRAALLPVLTEARLALARVQRLGDSLEMFAAASHEAQGIARGYDRDGRANRPGAAGVLDTRG